MALHSPTVGSELEGSTPPNGKDFREMEAALPDTVSLEHKAMVGDISGFSGFPSLAWLVSLV